MTYTSLRPVAKTKRKFNKKVGIPLLILLVLVGYAGISFYLKSKEDPVVLKTLCNFNHIESRELFEDREFDKLLEMNDYFVYGETLNLFNSTYDMFNPDMFIGKTLVLVNLCDQSERVYMMESNVDGQIPMEDLPVGFYEVYVMHNLERHRLFTNGYVEDVFTTINRQDQTKQIRLIGDAFLLENTRSEKQTFDRNYLFLEVTPTTLEEDVVDIVIDPGHYDFDSGWLDLGVKAYDLIEANENYKMALALKKEFEKYGLNVLITRDKDETVNTYDVDGRLYRAYANQAKYYLQIQMVGSSNPNIVGTQIIYSSYTSPRLASSVFKQLIENTRLQSTGVSGTGNIPGVLPSGRANGYDGRMVIRESGGKALTAATYSEKSEENSSFALDNRRGIQTLILEYLYLTHQPSAEYWLEEYELYAEQTVKGFVNYLQLEVVEEKDAD
jgi:N-acetylmuramoyl-L-alanine amidase